VASYVFDLAGLFHMHGPSGVFDCERCDFEITEEVRLIGRIHDAKARDLSNHVEGAPNPEQMSCFVQHVAEEMRLNLCPYLRGEVDDRGVIHQVVGGKVDHPAGVLGGGARRSRIAGVDVDVEPKGTVRGGEPRTPEREAAVVACSLEPLDELPFPEGTEEFHHLGVLSRTLPFQQTGAGGGLKPSELIPGFIEQPDQDAADVEPGAKDLRRPLRTSPGRATAPEPVLSSGGCDFRAIRPR